MSNREAALLSYALVGFVIFLGGLIWHFVTRRTR